MALTVEKPKSFSEYVELLEAYRSQGDTPLWYRGCGDDSHKLIPTLYRHPTKKKTEDLQKLERQLLTWFRQRSIPFRSRSLDDPWEAFFYMQHYGVPTRLLDWSENPFISLFFAMSSASKELSKSGKIAYASDATIWLLRPVEWNRHALSHSSFTGEILTPGDDPLKAYTPNLDFNTMHSYPVAIHGAHNSPRIVAQRGAFTIFGQNTSPMEEMFTKDKFPSESLIKIVLKRSVIANMRDAVLRHGITESVVFPDLQGLAQEIKRTFGFEG